MAHWTPGLDRDPIDLPGSSSEVWPRLRAEAQVALESEPALRSLLHSGVLRHQDLASALSYQLARKLGSPETPAMSLRDIVIQALEDDPTILKAAELDLVAISERDPASEGYLKPFLFFKGFLALQTHRIAHWLHRRERDTFAAYLQSRNSEICHVDIHPASRIGHGIFIDHGTGIVIGETVVIDNDVSILQGVTLGGTGARSGDRHPKIGSGVLLSAGAKVLGNVTIGDNAKVGAGSVVLMNVPAGCTAVGSPARLVNCPNCSNPARSMDQSIPGLH